MRHDLRRPNTPAVTSSSPQGRRGQPRRQAEPAAARRRSAQAGGGATPGGVVAAHLVGHVVDQARGPVQDDEGVDRTGDRGRTWRRIRAPRSTVGVPGRTAW